LKQPLPPLPWRGLAQRQAAVGHLQQRQSTSPPGETAPTKQTWAGKHAQRQRPSDAGSLAPSRGRNCLPPTRGLPRETQTRALLSERNSGMSCDFRPWLSSGALQKSRRNGGHDRVRESLQTGNKQPTSVAIDPLTSYTPRPRRVGGSGWSGSQSKQKKIERVSGFPNTKKNFAHSADIM